MTGTQHGGLRSDTKNCVWEKVSGWWGVVESSLAQDFKNRLNPHRNALLVKSREGGSNSLGPLKVHTPTEKLGAGCISEDPGEESHRWGGMLGEIVFRMFS